MDVYIRQMRLFPQRIQNLLFIFIVMLGTWTMRWTDLIRTRLDTGIHDAIHVARDRDRWKTFLREIMKGGRDSQL
jgi:hypothetical protein